MEEDIVGDVKGGKGSMVRLPASRITIPTLEKSDFKNKFTDVS